VTGLYRHVRNPIYVSVVAIILGQALLFGDWRLFLYGALVFVAFHIFVLAYEEPTLRESYGAEYETYRANFPVLLSNCSGKRGLQQYRKILEQHKRPLRNWFRYLKSQIRIHLQGRS
jgi:hypothetical protein